MYYSGSLLARIKELFKEASCTLILLLHQLLFDHNTWKSMGTAMYHELLIPGSYYSITYLCSLEETWKLQ